MSQATVRREEVRLSESPAPPLPVVLAVNIAAERAERGWSQERLAVYAGVTRETIGNVEAARDPMSAKGGTTVRTLTAVAAAFEIPWTELVRVRRDKLDDYDRGTRVFLDGFRARLIPGSGDRRPASAYVQPPVIVTVP